MAPPYTKQAQNDPKTLEIYPNRAQIGPNRPKMTFEPMITPQNQAKQSKNRSRCSKQAEIGSNRLKIGPNRSKWPPKPPKKAKTGPK